MSSDSTSNSLAEILHPKQAPKMSGRMIALLGYLFGKTWTDPKIADVKVVEPGVVLARMSGEAGHNRSIGHVTDLCQNLREWFGLFDLGEDQKEELRRAVRKKFGPDVEARVFERPRSTAG